MVLSIYFFYYIPQCYASFLLHHHLHVNSFIHRMCNVILIVVAKLLLSNDNQLFFCSVSCYCFYSYMWW